MWKCCTVGAYSASQSVALRLVLHLWAELTCISASKLRICTTGLACQHPSMGRLFLFHTLCLFLQHCPPQSTERFLKLALQNRKCRFSHVWIRWLVHNEDREGLDLICISLNDHSWHSLIYPSAKDLAQGWELGGVGNRLVWNNRSCVSTAWLKGMNERIYLNISMSIVQKVFIY